MDATLYEGKIVTPTPTADVKTGPAHELRVLAQRRQDRLDEWDRRLVPIATTSVLVIPALLNENIAHREYLHAIDRSTQRIESSLASERGLCPRHSSCR